MQKNVGASSSIVHVAVAIITNQYNEVLVSLRAKEAHQGGLWEFPGGKLEQGESVFDALKREIFEELNISINKAFAFKKIQYNYVDKNVLLDIWRVESFSGEPVGAEGQQVKWLAINDLKVDEFPAANRAIIQALKLPESYMITGSFESHSDFEFKLENSLKKGIKLVQLRCKKTSDKEYKQLAEISASLCNKYNAILLLNTSLGIFTSVSAQGLHLSSQMLSTFSTRPIDDDLILSVSCHSEIEIERAKQLKADIILLSPVKETSSHPGVKGMGWQRFSELLAAIETPVFALGGMAEADIDDAKSSGAQGVAAISSFWKA